MINRRERVRERGMGWFNFSSNANPSPFNYCPFKLMNVLERKKESFWMVFVHRLLWKCHQVSKNSFRTKSRVVNLSTPHSDGGFALRIFSSFQLSSSALSLKSEIYVFISFNSMFFNDFLVKSNDWNRINSIKKGYLIAILVQDPHFCSVANVGMICAPFLSTILTARIRPLSGQTCGLTWRPLGPKTLAGRQHFARLLLIFAHSFSFDHHFEASFIKSMFVLQMRSNELCPYLSSNLTFNLTYSERIFFKCFLNS